MTRKTRPYYPVLLDLAGKRCLVVGGGAVGARKARALLSCGARVVMVSPDLCPELAALAGQGAMEARTRPFEPGDLEGMFLVIGATDDEAENQRISREARARNVLVNIADRPEACSFILPSVVRQKDLVIAISTSGKSPAFAKRLRRDLEKQFGPEYGDFLELMGAIREKLLARAHAPEEHKALFERLISGGLLELLRDKKLESADALLYEVLGPGFRVSDLMPE